MDLSINPGATSEARKTQGILGEKVRRNSREEAVGQRCCEGGKGRNSVRTKLGRGKEGDTEGERVRKDK